MIVPVHVEVLPASTYSLSLSSSVYRFLRLSIFLCSLFLGAAPGTDLRDNVEQRLAVQVVVRRLQTPAAVGHASTHAPLPLHARVRTREEGRRISC